MKLFNDLFLTHSYYYYIGLTCIEELYEKYLNTFFSLLASD